jgi:hypothetical protein
LSLAACVSEHAGRPGSVPIRRLDQEFFECCSTAMVVAMRLWDGRRCEVLELAGALRVALAEPRAEELWLAGEDVFAGVERQGTIPGIDQHAAFLLQRYAALA